MKTLLNNKMLLFILLLVVAGGCNINVGYKYHPDKYIKVYIPQANPTPAKRSIYIIDSTQAIKYTAAVAGPHTLDKDVTVHFSVNPALVDSFNVNNSTSYPILPKDSYKLTTKKAVIPAGERRAGVFKIKVFAEGNIQVKEKYLLPVSISVNENAPINEEKQTAYFLIEGSYLLIGKQKWEVIDHDQDYSNKRPGANHPASNAIDGDKSTFWSSVKGGSPPPHYIVVDMHQTNGIHGMIIYAKNFHYGFHPKKIKLQFSDDGTHWKFSETFTLPSNKELHSKIYLSHTVDARYFKYIVLETVRPNFRTSHTWR